MVYTRRNRTTMLTGSMIHQSMLGASQPPAVPQGEQRTMVVRSSHSW